MNLREQACWFTLVFESRLSIRNVNDILVSWCKQAGRTVEEFFAADTQEWRTICHLKEDFVERLEEAKEKLVAQAFLAEQLEHSGISLITVLDEQYPSALKAGLDRAHIPPILFYAGDLNILDRQTIAIIGSRNAGGESLIFTRTVASYLVQHNANVISGHARGVDRAAYEGATSAEAGHTTVVLPHGIRKLSNVQLRNLQPRIEAGNALLISQFHPDAPWLVSRAMERNNVVTGLAQVVVVAESDTKGGTWEGANGALKQKRRVFVRQANDGETLFGNTLLIEQGGEPLLWPSKDADVAFASLLETAQTARQKYHTLQPPTPPNQLPLLAISNE